MSARITPGGAGEQTTVIDGVEVKWEVVDTFLEVGMASLERLIEAGVAMDHDEAWDICYKRLPWT